MAQPYLTERSQGRWRIITGMSQIDRDDRSPGAVPLSRPENCVRPKKLLLSKWTAVTPLHKEKHFVVIRVIEPELPEVRIDQVEVEAIHSRRTCVRRGRRPCTQPPLDGHGER